MSKKEKIEELAEMHKEMIRLSNKYNEVAKEIALPSRVGVVHASAEDHVEEELHKAVSEGVSEENIDEYVRENISKFDMDKYVRDLYWDDGSLYVDFDSSDKGWFPSMNHCW